MTLASSYPRRRWLGGVRPVVVFSRARRLTLFVSLIGRREVIQHYEQLYIARREGCGEGSDGFSHDDSGWCLGRALSGIKTCVLRLAYICTWHVRLVV